MSAGPYSINAGQSISPFIVAIVEGQDIDDLRDAVNLAYQRSGLITSSEENPDQVPVEFQLLQNYPNPFSAGSATYAGGHGYGYGGNSTTTIKYIIAGAGLQDEVSSKSYNESGFSPINSKHISPIVRNRTSGFQNQVPVSLTVYDVLGREVEALVQKRQQPGIYEVTWDASGQSSGIYFYRINVGNYTRTMKMIYIK
jgi:hypothetical protein